MNNNRYNVFHALQCARLQYVFIERVMYTCGHCTCDQCEAMRQFALNWTIETPADYVENAYLMNFTRDDVEQDLIVASNDYAYALQHVASTN